MSEEQTNENATDNIMSEDLSLDDILAKAGSLMAQLGLDTDVLEEFPTEEDLKKEAEEKKAVFFDMRLDDDNPFEEVPVEIRKPKELSDIELIQLETKYGRQEVGRLDVHGRMIEEVRTLSPAERSIFSGEDFVSPQFNLQFLYKIHTEMDRRDITANIEKYFDEHPMLRVNFCMIGVDRKMHKIVFQKREPEVKILSLKFLSPESLNRTINRLMFNEREKTFDLQFDLLFRFSLVRVGEEHYGFIVTMSRLVASAWNETEFFEKVFGLKSAQEEKTSPEEAPFSLDAANYYVRLLNNLPPIPNLPRFTPDYINYTTRTQQIFLHKNLYEVMEKITGGKRDMMMAIICTAWGLMQKQFNVSRETYFAAILSEQNLVKNPEQSAGRLYPLPLRITVDSDNTPTDQLIGKMLRQMLMTRSIACTKMRYILKDIGDPNDIFPCLLHFQGFFQDPKDFYNAMVLKGFRLLDVEAFDAGKRDLDIYFEIINNSLRMTYRYNPFSFEYHTITPLAKYLEIAIGCLLLTYGKEFYKFENVYNENIKGWNKSFAKYAPRISGGGGNYLSSTNNI